MDEVLNLEQAAEFLKLHRHTIRKYWKAGAIPGRRVGQHYRFLRSDLIDWVSNGSTNRTPS